MGTERPDDVGAAFRLRASNAQSGSASEERRDVPGGDVGTRSDTREGEVALRERELPRGGVSAPLQQELLGERSAPREGGIPGLEAQLQRLPC